MTLFDFDREAARAAILYAASRTPSPSFHKLSKIFYFADRFHLERYGAYMFGAEYWALRHGPVPMEAYRLMCEIRDHPERSAAAGFTVETVLIDGYPAPVVRPLEAPDMGELSRSVVSCLEESIEHHGGKSFHELTAESHDAAWNAVGQDEVMSPELIAGTLPNAAELLKHLADPYP